MDLFGTEQGRMRLSLCLGLLVLLWGLGQIWEMLLPFLLAGLFAYMMMPLVRLVQYRLHVRNRGLSVLIVFLLLIAVLTSSLAYLIPEIQGEIAKTLSTLELYNKGDSILEMILPDYVHSYLRKSLDLRLITEYLSPKQLGQALSTLQEQAGSVISGTLSVFSWGIVFSMGIIYFIFIMIDFEGLGNGVAGLFPEAMRPQLRQIYHELDYYMNGYFRGQALIALSVGILVTIGFNIIGLPMATALGVFIGVLNFIPYMQAVGIPPLILSAILMAAQTGNNVVGCILLALGVLLVVQIIQETLLVPRIMGATMGMRASLILLSLSVWGYLLGFFGLLIALPASMALYSFYMRYILKDETFIRQMDERLKSRKASTVKSVSKCV